MVIGISGMEHIHVEQQTRDLLKDKPRVLIISGFAGGLEEDLKSGDIVVADSVVCQHGNYCCDGLLTSSAKARLRDRKTRHIITVDEVVQTPAEKEAIRAKYACSAVDMESAVAAGIASCVGIPFIAIRSIVDDYSFAIPEALAGSVHPDGRPDLSILIKRPLLIVLALRLGLKSYRAARSLSDFLSSYMKTPDLRQNDL